MINGRVEKPNSEQKVKASKRYKEKMYGVFDDSDGKYKEEKDNKKLKDSLTYLFILIKQIKEIF